MHTAAWSGLGLVHNLPDPYPDGGNTTMSAIFTRTLATVNVDHTWDWSRWRVRSCHGDLLIGWPCQEKRDPDGPSLFFVLCAVVRRMLSSLTSVPTT